MYKSHFDQLYVVFFTVLLLMASPRGFAWALAAFLCCPSEILFHRTISGLNAGNYASEVLMVLWDICRQKVCTDFSYVMYLLDLS